MFLFDIISPYLICPIKLVIADADANHKWQGIAMQWWFDTDFMYYVII